MRPVIDDTQEALFDLADTLLQHGTIVQGNVGKGIGTSEAVPSYSQDPLTNSPNHTSATNCARDVEGLEHCFIPHPCTTSGGI